MGNGMTTLKKVYGPQSGKLLRNLSQLHPDVPAWIVRESYARVISRPGMPLGDRELLNIVVLAHQGMDRQLYSHLRGALRVGVPSRAIIAALRLGSRRSAKSVATSLRIFRALTAG